MIAKLGDETPDLRTVQIWETEIRRGETLKMTQALEVPQLAMDDSLLTINQLINAVRVSCLRVTFCKTKLTGQFCSVCATFSDA